MERHFVTQVGTYNLSISYMYLKEKCITDQIVVKCSFFSPRFLRTTHLNSLHTRVSLLELLLHVDCTALLYFTVPY